ncbi:phage holin family protein [Bacteroides fragilis]|uniref:phage holin family protein n=1 Tax=Bacteroides fragilis TaxID=817 RepID=UPI0039B6C1A9
MKNLFVGLLTGLAAYLNPISGDIKSLVILFFFNFLFGLAAGLLANNESFSLKKAFRCIIEAMVFFLLVAAIYFIGDHKGNPDGALQCVSFITYSIFYFYGVNILRNLKLMATSGTAFYKVVSFLYYVVSVEFIKHIPFLTNYQKEATK